MSSSFVFSRHIMGLSGNADLNVKIENESGRSSEFLSLIPPISTYCDMVDLQNWVQSRYPAPPYWNLGIRDPRKEIAMISNCYQMGAMFVFDAIVNKKHPYRAKIASSIFTLSRNR